MFTIHPYIQFAIIGVGVIGGVLLSIAWGFWYGFPLIIIGLIALLAYILLGTVGPAAKHLQSGDTAAAEQMLNLTYFPQYLYATNKAYFYMLKGSLAMSRKDINEGEKYLKLAEEVGVPSDNEKAMLQIQLANIAASRNKWQQVVQHHKKLKELKITEPTIKEQKAMLDQAVKNKGMLRAGGSPMGPNNMMRQKGKRRNPRMR